jgi:glycosyltransferase involved in cell wall biosynthesis
MPTLSLSEKTTVVSNKSAARIRSRVLIFNDTPRNGGPGKVLLHFLRYADKTRLFVDVHLMRPDVLSDIYESEAVADKISFDANLIENPIQPLRRPMERRDFDAPIWMKTLRSLINVPRIFLGVGALAWRMRRDRYDLLYCNGLYAVLIGGLLARLAGTPVLWHLHDTSLPKILRGVFRWMARSPNVRSIICVSKASAQMADFAADKTTVVLNPVDLDEFGGGQTLPALRREMGWADDAIIFGSHGRVVARKGYQVMVRAARIVIDEAPAHIASKMRFVVVGDTPEDHPGEHLAECRSLVDELGLREQFAFIGYRRDVCPYVADYDVCVVPSVFAEPFGLTVVEGFAFSLPVIASAVGGIPEIVRAGETGLLVPPDDPDALAAAMLTYARNYELRRQHGAAARLYVCEHHDARLYSKAIEHLVIAACKPDRASV